ncbi:MAG: isoprenylcysteine carboxylmethyltransferase family protein, partial [Thermoanaerobaculia bacterium]|nr:isoprenylcysteine carboxylmethyltransferase family protein [Thermoanaerobaculia bacterium]
AAMALRYWAVSALGGSWCTRVIVVPGRARVVAGPYRFLRHPNYLAVAVEIFALPLVHGAWWTALAFSAANAWLLSVRIRVEETALASLASPGSRREPGAGAGATADVGADGAPT